MFLAISRSIIFLFLPSPYAMGPFGTAPNPLSLAPAPASHWSCSELAVLFGRAGSHARLLRLPTTERTRDGLDRREKARAQYGEKGHHIAVAEKEVIDIGFYFSWPMIQESGGGGNGNASRGSDGRWQLLSGRRWMGAGSNHSSQVLRTLRSWYGNMGRCFLSSWSEGGI